MSVWASPFAPGCATSREEEAYEWFTNARRRQGNDAGPSWRGRRRISSRWPWRDREERRFWRGFRPRLRRPQRDGHRESRGRRRQDRPNTAFVFGASAFVTWSVRDPDHRDVLADPPERLAELWGEGPRGSTRRPRRLRRSGRSSAPDRSGSAGPSNASRREGKRQPPRGGSGTLSASASNHTCLPETPGRGFLRKARAAWR